MKIGIVTWFHYENYGTALQAFSLQYFLRLQGYECHLINYIPDTHRPLKSNVKNFPMVLIEKIKSLIVRQIKMVYKDAINLRSNRFHSFIKNNCLLTEKMTKESLPNVNDQFEVFITGSDQIWNPKVMDSVYYLGFVNDHKKKIAYAPSFGVSQIPEEKLQILSKMLHRFDYLAVREADGAKIINTMINHKVEVVLDPTLLLTSQDWDTVVSSNSEGDSEADPYILCYFLGGKKYYWEQVYRLSIMTGLKIKIIPMEGKDFFRKDEKIMDAGPEEFLILIKNARFVCTDSFHGTLFSIMYKKDFLVFKRFNDENKYSENSRIYNILSELGLENRLLNDTEKIEENMLNISEYGEVHRKLEKRRIQSIDYLVNSINEQKIFNGMA